MKIDPAFDLRRWLDSLPPEVHAEIEKLGATLTEGIRVNADGSYAFLLYDDGTVRNLTDDEMLIPVNNSKR